MDEMPLAAEHSLFDDFMFDSIHEEAAAFGKVIELESGPLRPVAELEIPRKESLWSAVDVHNNMMHSCSWLGDDNPEPRL